MASNSAPQMSPQQQNAMARQSILANSVERIQQVFSTTLNSLNTGNNVINVVPRNVGLIKGFFVEISLNFTVTGAPLVITPFGAANILQQIQFNDLQNNTRIQTAGWHLHAVNTARIGRPFGMAYGMASNGGLQTVGAPQTVTLGASPATYTNTSGVAGNLNIVAGTVSQITVTMPGSTAVVTGAIDGIIPLPPGASATVTYSVAPTSVTFTPQVAPANAPVSYTDSWLVQVAPAIVPVSTPTTIVFRYYVPLAYSKTDLRGAVYANVINATMQLQLALNTNFVVAQNADNTLAVYQASTAATPVATVNNVNVTVYQHYLDQLPMGAQGPLLPWLDLSTIYELKNVTMTGLSANQDFPIPYSNYRSYLSTFFIYDNAGTKTFGSDMNYISLQSANYTNLIKVTPDELALLSYVYMQQGWPQGTYYLSHRDDPISTIQYGNMDLILNASSASVGAQVLVGYEDLAMTNLLNNASSMPGG